MVCSFREKLGGKIWKTILVRACKKGSFGQVFGPSDWKLKSSLTGPVWYGLNI